MKTFKVHRYLLKQDIAQAILDLENENSKYRTVYYSAVLADLIIKELPRKAQNSKLWRDAGGYMPSPFSHLQAVLVCEDKYFLKKPAEYTCICLRGQIIRKACPRKTITAAIADAVETWEYAQKGIIQ